MKHSQYLPVAKVSSIIDTHLKTARNGWNKGKRELPRFSIIIISSLGWPFFSSCVKEFSQQNIFQDVEISIKLSLTFMVTNNDKCVNNKSEEVHRVKYLGGGIMKLFSGGSLSCVLSHFINISFKIQRGSMLYPFIPITPSPPPLKHQCK